MALITCVECGNEFSDKAEACPKCGCPTSESTKASDAPEEASTEATRKPAYGQPPPPQNPSSRGPAEGTKTNGCAMGCGALILGLIVLGAIGSIFGDSDSPNSKRTPRAFDKIAAEVYCKRVIKKQLRDPDSYRFEQAVVLSSDGANGTAKIYFRSKNGFGGYVRGTATCTAYEKDGERWFRAVID